MDMPIPQWKGTFIYNSLAGDFGWSEVYYVGEPDLAHAALDFQNLWVARRLLLTDNMALVEGRVSQEGVFGDAAGFTIAMPTGMLSSTMLHPTDRISALLIRTGVADRKSRGHKFLHGAVEEMFDDSDRYTTTFSGNADVQAFCTLLGGPPYALRSNRAGAGVAYPNLTGATPVRKAFHRIGRAFGQPRGRRSGV